MKAQTTKGAHKSETGQAVRKSFKQAIQVGAVVQNLELSIKTLSSVFGIGPFRVVECPPIGRRNHQFLNGKPARFRTRQAFADLGSVELELIQPLSGNTIWQQFLRKRGPGIHHIRFNVPNHQVVSDYLRQKGFQKTQEGAGIRPGSYWINYDTERLVGFVIEIMQPALGSSGRTPSVRRAPISYQRKNK